MIAIAVCTHNPDERLLERVLASILAQTLQPSECVLVDNASDPPIASRPAVADFLARSANARVVVEVKKGLSYARVAAIEQTSAPVLCFVDDDNEPAADYLEQAQRILGERACIGVLGPGKVVVDFVDPVPPWFAQRFAHHFQEKDHDGLAYGCAGSTWTDYYPPGSCMVVRREVLARYRDGVLGGQLSLTGRAGKKMTSGDDTQIVWEAVKMELAAGISGTLRIKHMIPARRSTMTYMKRLCYGTSSSYLPALTGSFPEEARKLPAPPAEGQIAWTMFKIAARHIARMRLKLLPVALATYAGRTAGLVRATGSERKWLSRWIRLLGLE
jgi:glucosyl-dolichyl phosphate glucuronosyltransferase